MAPEISMEALKYLYRVYIIAYSVLYYLNDEYNYLTGKQRTNYS